MNETVDKCHRNRVQVPKKDASNSAAVVDLGWTSCIVFESHSTDVQLQPGFKSGLRAGNVITSMLFAVILVE